MIEVSCITDGQEMCVSVTDEGIGIRAEDINQLFERYYRVESTKYISGFGIGLYLCAE
ncbi:MAG TPA: two-component sensor histidine kinase, partial [Sphingobacterium sp.]|nr:two-component sensor histidine kinase [Sphingobacterium sp.]